MKKAGMRIRVEAELREDFVEACRSKHVPAAQVIREFMRNYISKGSSTATAQTKTNNKKRQLKKYQACQLHNILILD